MDQGTRKLMMMYKAFHTRNGVDNLFMSRKEGGRRLAVIENTVEVSIQGLEAYIKKSK